VWEGVESMRACTGVACVGGVGVGQGALGEGVRDGGRGTRVGNYRDDEEGDELLESVGAKGRLDPRLQDSPWSTWANQRWLEGIQMQRRRAGDKSEGGGSTCSLLSHHFLCSFARVAAARRLISSASSVLSRAVDARRR
jgi:hypothetical protein